MNESRDVEEMHRDLKSRKTVDHCPAVVVAAAAAAAVAEQTD